ncbi:MAG: PQQ-dependent sugar dehydrogenase, partial [Saprospiraceae bacterium]|nr:PQQ-dependent sugar dehydrogenase [Saprospiraceae bacterium]
MRIANTMQAITKLTISSLPIGLMIAMSLLFMHCSGHLLPEGDPDNAGLVLPAGFEALSVVDSLGKARHLAVRTNGDIYVKMRYPLPEGENAALRDTDGDGKADVVKFWGDYGEQGRYGNAMRIHKGYLYLSTAGQVYRHKLRWGKLLPKTEGELLMTDDYENAEHGYEHIAKPLAFDQAGHMYVQFGAPGDCCQVENRKPGSPGQMPCPELEWHGGVWQFSDSKPNQLQKDGVRYATGIRSIVGMDWYHVDNTLYALQHGRDNLHRMWSQYYSAWESAMLPSEEFLRVPEGTDAGWPYYYYDQMQGKKLLNPEYGGDGTKEGDGKDYAQPLIGFPGHWAPNDLLFYKGSQFPEHYKHGAFIAFHGSTIRAPYPQSGYFIGFVPFSNGVPSGTWEIFADGFGEVDTLVNTSDATYRPMGLAEGPDGSLYISESEKGKIWRVMFKGEKNKFGSEQLSYMETRKNLPHIKTPDEIFDNLDRGRLVAGERLYKMHCAACHLNDGKGDGTRFPPIDQSQTVMGDPKILIDLVLNGKEGVVEVKGETFEGAMPGFDYLTDKEIAQI